MISSSRSSMSNITNIDIIITTNIIITITLRGARLLLQLPALRVGPRRPGLLYSSLCVCIYIYIYTHTENYIEGQVAEVRLEELEAAGAGGRLVK